jgi:phage terminase large subunit GpA-like protein
MDAIGDHNVEKVVIQKAARTGITYSAILNVFGYYVNNEPCPIILVYPTEQNARKFSKKNLSQFIRDCKAIAHLFPEEKSRDGDNTILLKTFPGGSLTLVGANSPNSLRADTAKIVMIDEVDGEIDVREGDYIQLVENRTLSYAGRGRKIILLSTPTDKIKSAIEPEYLNSTMEKFHLPCPSCGEMQPLEWERIDLEAITHQCCECGEKHTRPQWIRDWENTGKWIAQNPEHLVRGFHISALYSPFLKWEFMVEKYNEAIAEYNIGQHGKLQVFKNTYLGETWEDQGERVDETGLMERRQAYFFENDYNHDPSLVPDGVCVITIGVDTQDNRLEYEVVGHGAGLESWGLEYGILPGDPRVPHAQVWGLLDDLIRKPRRYLNGVQVPVVCTVIDYGGHAADQVSAYCKSRRGWNVWPINGVGGFGRLFVDLKKTFRTKVASATGFSLGVDTGKDELFARLRLQEQGAGYCRFPRGTKRTAYALGGGDYETVRGYDERYFAGLTSEKKVAIRKTGGHHSYRWQLQRGARNEPLDCRVYASAAILISRVNVDDIASKAPWLRDDLTIDDTTIENDNKNITPTLPKRPTAPTVKPSLKGRVGVSNYARV